MTSDNAIGLLAECDHPHVLAQQCRQALQQVTPGVWDAVVVDDLSLLAERTMQKLESKHAGSRNKFALWDDLRDTVIRFREVARAAGLHVILNAHERQPETKDGVFGPMLRNPTYTGITPQFWGTLDMLAGPDEWVFWGTPNCGKGQPMQVGRTGHPAVPARFSDVRMGVRG